MGTNRIYSLCIAIAFVACIGANGCKKSSGGSQPVVDNTITYDLSFSIYPNPERGFIHTYPVYTGGASLSLPELKLQRGQNISLVLRVFYLDGFKTTAIDATELTLIQTDLDKIREAGLKGILRFAYTDDLTGTDASLAIVEQHLDQLKPIFETNKDIIAFVQAGFIGAWGEWHSSSNGLATTDNQRKVLNKLLAVLPADIMVQVRTPIVKQQIFNNTQPVTSDIAYSTENRARVGHHNDCFLSGGNEYGTYQNVEAEKQYISNEALFVPVGGETCPPTGGFSPTCAEGQKDMKLLKWTYLNLDWYQPTVNAWKTSGCFDEFQRYLGHRLALVTATIPKEVTVNGNLSVNLTISNKGYAPLYNKKTTTLILKNKISGQLYPVAMAVDMRKSKPLAEFVVDETLSLAGIPAGDYDVYLRIADQAASIKNRIEYSVRLGNADTWVEENGGMNSLKRVLKIM
jgi:Domain of unknown function (DUF4832)/Domain of unknown function (DUF4874)